MTSSQGRPVRYDSIVRVVPRQRTALTEGIVLEEEVWFHFT